MVLLAASVHESGFAQTEGRVQKGREIAFDRNKGNCLACHWVKGAELPGEVGPPLVAMGVRFPERAALRDQIWDASRRNPETLMPPYGRHGILTELEIDLLVDFVHTL